MKKSFVTAALLLALFSGKIIAQIPPVPPLAAAPPTHEKSESIIIHTDGKTKEKLTIVVDGDNITINGKPAKEYKDRNVEIIHDNDDAMNLLPPMPPMPPHGGSKMFGQSFAMHSNDAVLGIMPEDDDNGAKISDLTKGSAADKAGLKEGDVITKIEDKKIESADDVYDAISKYKPSDKVTITYKRNGKESTATASLDKNTDNAFRWNNNDVMFNDAPFPNSKNFAFNWNDKPRLGLRIQDTENSQGVTVTDINDDDAPAAKAGLKEDDIITEINGKTVTSVKDMKDKLKDIKPGSDISLKYKRGAALQSATLHIPKPLQSSDL